jgi:hypothetical protein
MSIAELFAVRTERRRRLAQQSLEEGARISRRLQELLAAPIPTPSRETTDHSIPENDSARVAGKTEALAQRS